MTVPSEDSDQPGHPPSLIRVFAVCSKDSQGPGVSSCGQRRLRSDWAEAQADPSLGWAHRSFCWFCHEAAKLIVIKATFQIIFDVFIRAYYVIDFLLLVFIV